MATSIEKRRPCRRCTRGRKVLPYLWDSTLLTNGCLVACAETAMKVPMLCLELRENICLRRSGWFTQGGACEDQPCTDLGACCHCRKFEVCQLTVESTSWGRVKKLVQDQNN